MDGIRQSGSVKLPASGEGRIAIIAGSGKLPAILARNLQAKAGSSALIVLISGEADASLKEFDHIEIPLEHVSSLPAKLKSAGVTHVVLGGGISRRPSLTALKPSLALFRFVFRIVKALSRGDDKLLRTIIGAVEEEGLTVIGAQDIVPGILAGSGPLSRKKPTKTDRSDITSARSALHLIGSLDLGQAAVSVRGRIVAIEGPEGTDAMLKRVAELRASGRLPANSGGVLVKCAKPDQELRVDLPTIGPGTVAGAVEAGLNGIAVEADKALVLERERTVCAADEAGLFLIGIETGTQ